MSTLPEVEELDDETVPRTPRARPPEIPGFAHLREIGRGGFSTVYSAVEVVFDRHVAVKVLDAGGDDARRLTREARALGALSGIPHVLAPYSVTRTESGRPALVLPLMDTSIARIVMAEGRVTPVDAARWCGQVAAALDGVHAVGIHHRDIKPENILISFDGEAHVADFGIATVGGLDAATVTASSLSPPHAPPERFGDAPADLAAGDRYSLASTFYTALTGRAPFGTAASGGIIGLAARISDDPVPPLSPELRPLDPVFERALSKRASDRYPTAKAFAKDLTQAVDSLRDDVTRGPAHPLSSTEEAEAGLEATWWTDRGSRPGRPVEDAATGSVPEAGDIAAPERKRDRRTWW